ncbi:MAG: hypothetical protein RL112_107, partial [Planctomycetota bacterium]
MPSVLLPLLLACVAAPRAAESAAAEGEFAAVLARLSAPELAVREEASRRLAGLAHEGRVGQLAAFLRGADEEARARAAAALASRGALLPVVAALATDSDARVARPGREALELATLAEASSVARPSLSGELEWLTRACSGVVRVEGALLAAPAEDLLPILVSAGGHPVGVAFDPDRAPEQARALPGGEGDLWRWLSALAQVRGLHHRLRRLADGRALLVLGGAPNAVDELDHAPLAQHADFLARGVRASLDAQAARRRAGCSALLASGWGAAQAWIEERASEGDEAAVAAVARAASMRGASPSLRAPAAQGALRRLLESAVVEGDLVRGASWAAALGASTSEEAWPMPAESRVARLLQLVEALHAPVAPSADAALPPLLSALVQPEADAVEVLWCWRVAARHGLALPASSADLHGARLAGALVAAGEAARLPELAGPTGRLLPVVAEPAGAPPELLLAAWCAAGDAAAARSFLERLRARSPLAAAKAWRAAGPWLGPRGAACAAAVVEDGAWIADEGAREEFLVLVGLRALPSERLSRLDEAQLDHLAGAKAGGPARVAWLERLDPARRARRS